MRRITLIYPYYENPAFFQRQLGHWNCMAADLREVISVVVVDDGSPSNPAEKIVRSCGNLGFDFRLFRIEVDVRWNWLAARNIAAHHATDKWILLTDMDHVVPLDVLRTLVSAELSDNTIYRFSRREHDGKQIHPHPNSWFMTRQMYWAIGGYDEDASGYYGTDGDYRRRAAETATVEILPLELERHEYQGDSSTTAYKRKQREDARGKQILRDKARRGLPPKVLSFPYHEVQI